MQASEERTLVDRLRRHAVERPGKPVFKFEGRVTTFGDFERRTNRVANGYVAAGIGAGDRVGYLGKNTDLYFETWFGAMKVGAVMAPIGWRLALPEILYMIRDSGLKALFVGRESLTQIAAAADEIPEVRIFAAEGGDASYPSFEAWRDAQSDAPPVYRAQPDDIAIQLYTSGTTGRPKGAMLSQKSFMLHLGAMVEADVEWNRWGPDDVSLVPMPIAHIGGSGWAIWGVYHGATAIVERQFDIDSTFDQIERERITKIFIVPSAMQMMVRHPRARSIDYSCIRHMNYGSSPIAPALLRECIEVFGCGFTQMYGMTETIGTIIALPPEDHLPEGGPKMSAAGKPLPGVEIAIVDAAGNRLGPRQVGEVVTRSAANMTGYWNLPEATARTIDPDGWLHTGDAGYLDEDGFLYIHDRIKDMIISGGENIYPTEIENQLSEHPDVGEVAVIGVPDERWGEAVKAFVVRRPGRTIDEAELLAWLRPRIAGFKMPKSIEFPDALPRNPTGKLLKRELRERFWADHNRRVA